MLLSFSFLLNHFSPFHFFKPLLPFQLGPGVRFIPQQPVISGAVFLFAAFTDCYKKHSAKLVAHHKAGVGRAGLAYSFSLL